MKKAAPIYVTLFGLLIAGCSSPPPALSQSRIYSMGTWVDLTIRDAADAEAAISDIETMLASFETDYYAWTPGQLATLNESIARAEASVVSPELAALLHEARELSARSGGLFEPGLGALVELWGFQSPLTDRGTPPSAAELEAQLADARIAALTVEGTSISSSAQGLKLDLGGIAKGAAIDIATTILSGHGVEHALVNAGGDLSVLGRSGGMDNERPWRVGIRHPREDGLLGIVELEAGEATFTSGDYERFFESDGQRLHHLLDPETGRPAEHTQAVTVIADSGTLADAAATAIFVAGPERWRETAEALGIDAALRVDAGGSVEMTAAMLDRMTPVSGGDSDIITLAGQDDPR